LPTGLGVGPRIETPQPWDRSEQLVHEAIIGALVHGRAQRIRRRVGLRIRGDDPVVVAGSDDQGAANMERAVDLVRERAHAAGPGRDRRRNDGDFDAADRRAHDLEPDLALLGHRQAIGGPRVHIHGITFERSSCRLRGRRGVRGRRRDQRQQEERPKQA
jgi:hypothetical protein